MRKLTVAFVRSSCSRWLWLSASRRSARQSPREGPVDDGSTRRHPAGRRPGSSTDDPARSTHRSPTTTSRSRTSSDIHRIADGGNAVARPLREPLHVAAASRCSCARISATGRRARPPCPTSPGTVTGTLTPASVVGPTRPGNSGCGGRLAEILARSAPGSPTPTSTRRSYPGRRDPDAAQRPRWEAGQVARLHVVRSSRRITASPNSAARAPSTTRWSNVTET